MYMHELHGTAGLGLGCAADGAAQLFSSESLFNQEALFVDTHQLAQTTYGKGSTGSMDSPAQDDAVFPGPRV